MFGWFVTGLFVGMMGVVLIGALDGLFGEWLLHVILVTLAVVFLGSLAIRGPASVAADVEPIPYWIGFFIGCLVGCPAAAQVSRHLQVNQSGRLRVWVRGVRE